MAKQTEAEKVVPPRNDPSPLEPYSRSRWSELKGLDPNFEHQFFRRDELAKKLVAHEIGNQFTGFLMVDGWEVVDTSKGVTQGRPRDDAGSPTDTTMGNGELVLCRTPKENYAKYQIIERAQDALIEKRLSTGEKHNFGGGVNFKTRNAGGREGLEAAVSDVYGGVR